MCMETQIATACCLAEPLDRYAQRPSTGSTCTNRFAATAHHLLNDAQPVFLLARTGIEPVRPFTGPGILSPVRLPVSPPGREENSIVHDVAES